MQTLAVLITTPPHSNLTATAISYVESALESGVKVVGVFFYQAGVLNANKFVDIPNDEFQTVSHWKRLHQQYQLPLHLCFTAAEKHGLTDDSAFNNIDTAFTISGLGELVELTSIADRVVQL